MAVPSFGFSYQNAGFLFASLGIMAVVTALAGWVAQELVFIGLGFVFWLIALMYEYLHRKHEVGGGSE